MPSSELQIQSQQPRLREGVTVIGEAVRRLTPENAEFLVEITASAPNAAQALRDNQSKIAQISQTVAQFGVQSSDIQSLSLNVNSLYAPLLQGYGPAPQIGPAGFQSFPAGMQPSGQPELQFGAYHAVNVLRVTVREPARVGEVADTIARSGVTVLGGFCFRPSDEGHARRAALDAAGKDAKSKAEALAVSAGRQLGDLVAITEEIIASNGDYAALRAAVPFAFGAGAPRVVGELEFYARVSANFRFQ